MIIPTLNEATHLPRTLQSVVGDREVEVIVVDGGSTDRTREIAWAHEAEVLVSPPGKARQMNRGGLEASGTILLFLHADTLLPPGWTVEIEQILTKSRVVAGAFRLCIDKSGLGIRLIEIFANFRARHLQLPYGDQTLFLRSEVFRELDGFRDMPIMEDYEFVCRLTKRGRILVSRLPVTCSARRWDKMGLLRTTVLNWAIVVAYRLGVSPARLAEWYRSGAISR